jgi:1-aminocyclopropane-1-carboxylate deaminase/D-cysteine desulfhydrase-like pyridoxal-dependent ACC family enzyme
MRVAISRSYEPGTMRRVPAWTPDPLRFPRFELLRGPSPFQPMPRLSVALGGRVDLWIKREDLLPVAFGGNKLRNLEYLVGAALAAGADCLVTSGRRWSNHARLTAAAGAMAGLPVHLVLSGPPTDPPNPGLRLAGLFGATIHQTATDQRIEREERLAEVVGALRAAGRRPSIIEVGGSGLTGVIGQVMAGLELADDARANGLTIDAVIVPSATGGTQAGLLVGMATAGVDAAVRGFAVARPADELTARVGALVTELASLDGLAAVSRDRISLDASEFGPGYGYATSTADEAARLVAASEGILVDPIYTAKALAGLIGLVRRGELDGRTVVFWHAGGTPGLFEPLAG